MISNKKMIRETLHTRARNEILDLTPLVQRMVGSAEMQNGMVIIFSPHTTAGITINENADPDVKQDLLTKLSKLVPQSEDYYEHAEGNSDSHVKTACVGNSTTVLVEGGKVMLGRWQGIYLCEFDGPRERQVWFKLVGFDE